MLVAKRYARQVSHAKLRIASGRFSVVAEPVTPHHWSDMLFAFGLGLIPSVPAFFRWLGHQFETREARDEKVRDEVVEILKEQVKDLKAQNTSQGSEIIE